MVRASDSSSAELELALDRLRLRVIRPPSGLVSSTFVFTAFLAILGVGGRPARVLVVGRGGLLDGAGTDTADFFTGGSDFLEDLLL